MKRIEGKRKIKVKVKKTSLPLCACGCGQPIVKAGNKFILGHNSKIESPANADHRWKPGQSGNPKGSKTGSRNKASLATESLFLDEGERLTRKCIDLALNNNNIPALRLCIERICPVRRSAPIKIENMPKIKHIDDLEKLTGFLLESISTGKISPLDAEILSRIVDKHGKSLELTQIIKKIDALEEKLST
jgi:hypothetical protein